MVVCVCGFLMRLFIKKLQLPDVIGCVSVFGIGRCVDVATVGSCDAAMRLCIKHVEKDALLLDKVAANVNQYRHVRLNFKSIEKYLARQVSLR